MTLYRHPSTWIVTGQFLKNGYFNREEHICRLESWHVLFFFPQFFDTRLEGIFVKVNLGDEDIERIFQVVFQMKFH